MRLIKIFKKEYRFPCLRKGPGAGSKAFEARNLMNYYSCGGRICDAIRKATGGSGRK